MLIFIKGCSTPLKEGITFLTYIIRFKTILLEDIFQNSDF